MPDLPCRFADHPIAHIDRHAADGRKDPVAEFNCTATLRCNARTTSLPLIREARRHKPEFLASARLPRRSPLETPVFHDDNLTTERPTFVTHLECAQTGERYPADLPHNLSRAGKPLLVRYDLDGIARSLSKAALAQRPPDLWRYRELLPVRRREDIVSLGEAVTPLVPLPKISARLRCGEILVKDEGRLPTGSFKARGLVMAVSM